MNKEKEELINKLLEITKEMIIAMDMSYEDIKRAYVETKIILETYKSLEKGEENERDKS